MSKVDITISKNDVVELLIQEREDELTAQLKLLETEFNAMKLEVDSNPTKYVPKEAIELADLFKSKGYSETHARVEMYHCQYVVRMQNEAGASINLQFPIAGFAEVSKQMNEIRTEIHSMNQNVRKYRAKFTKDILNRSQEGKDLLKSLIQKANTPALLPE